MEHDVVGTAIAGLSAFIGALAGVGALAWWLASRFNNVYTRMNSMEKLLSTKIDDHEKLDLTRFAAQDLAIMRIELALQSEGKSLHRI